MLRTAFKRRIDPAFQSVRVHPLNVVHDACKKRFCKKETKPTWGDGRRPLYSHLSEYVFVNVCPNIVLFRVLHTSSTSNAP